MAAELKRPRDLPAVINTPVELHGGHLPRHGEAFYEGAWTTLTIEDWRVDRKWPDYLDWCDLLYFAVPVDFPQSLIAEDVGLIVADAYGGEILRHPPRRPVAAARRKALLIDCARLASERLARFEDPDFVDFV